MPERCGASVASMLPDWPPGTVTILSTAGEAPHAIPVSAAVRASPRRALIALAAGRASLARLRADDRVALSVLSRRIAITANGRARVIDEALLDGIVAVEIEVAEVQDHCRPEFELHSGVRWRWSDPRAERRDAEVRAALERLARGRAQ